METKKKADSALSEDCAPGGRLFGLGEGSALHLWTFSSILSMENPLHSER